MSLERTFSKDGQRLSVIIDEIFYFGKVQDFRVALCGAIEAVI